MNNSWRTRIVIDPAVHHGDPCIKGIQVPVSAIIGGVADADTMEDILAAYSVWPLMISVRLLDSRRKRNQD